VPGNGFVEGIIFLAGTFLQGENLRSIDRATAALVHCSFLGAVAFGDVGFSSAILVVLVLLL
jgi:hypothetical protein